MIPRSRDDAEAALSALGQADPSGFDLTAACIACAIHEDPDRDPGPALSLLDAIVAAGRAKAPTTPQEMALVLYGDFGFAGGGPDFDSPVNADILDILANRHGLPVGLGVVWRHLARALDLPLYGTNVPSRFLMRFDRPLETGTPEDPGFDLIDVFEGGVVVSLRDAAMLAQGSAEGRLLPSMVGPVPDRLMAVRLQTNLCARARAEGQLGPWARAALRRALLAPFDGRLWLEHCDAAIALGEMHSAMTSAAKALEDRHPDVAQQAQSVLQQLRRSLN